MDSKHLIGKRSEDMRRKEELAARPQFLLRGFLPLLPTSSADQRYTYRTPVKYQLSYKYPLLENIIKISTRIS